MKPDREPEVLDQNLRRMLGACDGQVQRSYAEFLRRAEGMPASRRSSTGRVAIAASLLVCAGVLAVILSHGSGAPPADSPVAAPAQDEKVKKPQASEEQSLQAQIAFQEKLLEKTTDEQERALVQATIKTLRAELGRSQKGKMVKKVVDNPDEPAEKTKKVPDKADDRASKLRSELDSVHMKMKNSTSDDDRARLEMRAKEIGQELKLLDQGSKKEPFINIKDVEMRLQKNPDDAEALVLRGRWLVDQGKGGEAIPDLDRAVAVKPDYAPAWLTRGMAHAVAGNFDKATEDIKRGAALDPNAKDLDYARGTLKKMGEAKNGPARSPKDLDRQAAALKERLDELKAMEANKDLSEDERAKAGKEAVRVQAEMEKLKASASTPEKKK